MGERMLKNPFLYLFSLVIGWHFLGHAIALMREVGGRETTNCLPYPYGAMTGCTYFHTSIGYDIFWTSQIAAEIVLAILAIWYQARIANLTRAAG